MLDSVKKHTMSMCIPQFYITRTNHDEWLKNMTQRSRILDLYIFLLHKNFCLLKKFVSWPTKSCLCYSNFLSTLTSAAFLDATTQLQQLILCWPEALEKKKKNISCSGNMYLFSYTFFFSNGAINYVSIRDVLCEYFSWYQCDSQ